MDRDMDLEFDNDIHEALNKNQIPLKMVHIIPKPDEVEEINTELDIDDEIILKKTLTLHLSKNPLQMDDKFSEEL